MYINEEDNRHSSSYDEWPFVDSYVRMFLNTRIVLKVLHPRLVLPAAASVYHTYYSRPSQVAGHEEMPRARTAKGVLHHQHFLNSGP